MDFRKLEMKTTMDLHGKFNSMIENLINSKLRVETKHHSPKNSKEWTFLIKIAKISSFSRKLEISKRKVVPKFSLMRKLF